MEKYGNIGTLCMCIRARHSFPNPLWGTRHTLSLLNKNNQHTVTAFITVRPYITKKTTPKMIVNVKVSTFSIIHAGCGKKM